MKTFRIPIYFTFVNWLIVVIVGSLLCPLFAELILEHGGGFNFDSIELIGMCSLLSAIFSLPALIILLVTHVILNRRADSKLSFTLIHNLVHFTVALITFFVIFAAIDFDEGDEILVLICSYVPIAIFIWNLTYYFRKEQEVGKPKNNEVLDEI